MRRRQFLGAGAALLLAGSAKPTARKSCILLNLVGGPSQLDTWDLKPDAPSSVRGPFRPIRTNVPGIEISEIFPRMAKCADKFALIRSCYHEGPALHDAGHYLMQTGRAFDPDRDQPHIGSVAATLHGGHHVILPHRVATTNQYFSSPQLGGRLLTDTHFDLHTESEKTRQAYGLNRFGQSCLMARRLIETGATTFVTVNMFETVFGEKTWDSHGSSPFSSVADYRSHVGPMFDRAYSALIGDLQDRGLLPTTLVAGIGEFGRAPKLNPLGGRDHWPGCFTVHMAGGGIQGGRVYGSSDAAGSEPRDNPVGPEDIAGTIFKALDVPVGKPIQALFA